MRKGLGYVGKTKIRRGREAQGKSASGKWGYALWIAYPALFVLLSQALAYGTLAAPFRFVAGSPLEFILTSILVVTLAFLLRFLIRNRWIAFSVLHGLMVLITLGNRITLSVADTGLALGNLGIFNELKLLEQAEPGIYGAFFLLLFPSLAILYFIVYKMPSWRESVKYRMPAGLAFILFFLLFSRILLPAWTLKEEEVATADQLGVLLFFNNGIREKGNIAYPGKEEVLSLYVGIQEEDRVNSAKADIILLEVPGLLLPEDLGYQGEEMIPALRSLLGEGTLYQTDLSVSRTKGLGATFEALAGLPGEYHPGGERIKGNIISPDTISLASILAGEGYEGSAVIQESGTKDQQQLFFSSLGFSQSFFQEDFKDKDLIAVIAGILDQGEEPDFIFARLTGLEGDYSDRAIGNYYQDLRALDQKIQALKERISGTRRPSILVVYSGSVPALGEEVLAEKLSPGLTGLEREQALSRGSMILWNNFNRKAPYPQGEETDLFQLGQILLTYGNVEMPRYFYYMERLMDQKITAFSPTYLKKAGVIFGESTPEYDGVENDLVMIIKDVLGPYRYGEGNPDRWLVKE